MTPIAPFSESFGVLPERESESEAFRCFISPRKACHFSLRRVSVIGDDTAVSGCCSGSEVSFGVGVERAGVSECAATGVLSGAESFLVDCFGEEAFSGDTFFGVMGAIDAGVGDCSFGSVAEAESSGKRKARAEISRGTCWREAWRISVRA